MCKSFRLRHAVGLPVNTLPTSYRSLMLISEVLNRREQLQEFLRCSQKLTGHAHRQGTADLGARAGNKVPPLFKSQGECSSRDRVLIAIDKGISSKRPGELLARENGGRRTVLRGSLPMPNRIGWSKHQGLCGAYSLARDRRSAAIEPVD